MTKTFASRGDTQARAATFTQLSENAYAYTADGDPNAGVVIGDDSVLVVDTTATPAMAQDLIARIRAVTDKPIRHLVLPTITRCACWGPRRLSRKGAGRSSPAGERTT